MTDSNNPSWKAKFKKILFGMLVVFILAVITVIANNYNQKRLFYKMVAAIKAQGLPTNTEELNNWYPVTDNCAEILKEADAFLEQIQFSDNDEFYDLMHPKDDNETFIKDKQQHLVMLETLAPFYKLIDQALSHKELHINYISAYEDDFSFINLWGISYLLNHKAKHLCFADNDPDKALAEAGKVLRLCSIWSAPFKFSDQYTYTESLINTTLTTLQHILLAKSPSPTALRKTSSKLTNLPNIYEVMHNYFIGERALAIQLMELPILHTLYTPPSPTVPFSEFSYIDVLIPSYEFIFSWEGATNILHQFSLLVDATKDFNPAKFDFKTILHTEEASRYNPKNFDNTKFVLDYKFPEAILHFSRTDAQTKLAAIATAIYADKLEGKEYPQDLAKFPADPYTGKPFKISARGEYLYIYSLGPDRADSNKWEILYTDGPYDSDEEEIDDIAFRLPLNPKKEQ